MANPSLQIGNSNWAIKKDNLLGYSSSGTRFFPIPITMTRASAGTRVNPQGLVETVELLGSEEVTNGDFASGTTGWSVSYSGTLNNTGNALNVVAIGVNDTRAATSITTVIGKIYKYVADITQVQSTVTNLAVSNNSNLDGAFVNGSNITTPENGVTVFFTATATTTYIGFKRGGSAATGITNIYDNVSVKEYAINNLARVDYTGSTSSLLAEPQRTNLITYSEDFSQWIANGVSLDYNQGTSPDGLSNATRLHTLTDGNLYVASANTSFENTISFYVKSNNQSKDNFQLRLGGTTTNYTATSDWVKYTYTTTPNSTVAAIRNVPSEDLDVLIYGAQLEEGSYATSYIPTDGSTVTRVQDQYSKTGISDKINSEEGTLFVEMAALANDGTYRYVLLSDGATANMIQIRYSDVSNNIQALVYSSSVLQAFTSYTPTDTTSFHKMAFKYKENDFALWVDGTEVGTATSGIPPINLSSLDFQSYFGKVKQLQVFKTALTDSELATLTT